MPLNWPVPSGTGQTYTFGGNTWVWDGQAWQSLGAFTPGPSGPIGPIGPTGVTGNTGPTGPAASDSMLLRFGHGTLSPTQATTYNIVDINDLPPLTPGSSLPQRYVVAPCTGTVESVTRSTVHTTPSSAPFASGETGTFNMLNVTLGTTATITNVATWGDGTSAGRVQHNFWNVSSPLSIRTGDLLLIEQIGPTWTVQPSALRQTFNVVIRRS